MAGLSGTFFDTSVLFAGTIDFGRSSHHALMLLDAVADGRLKILLVDQLRTSWNSLLCWLRDVQAWCGCKSGV